MPNEIVDREERPDNLWFVIGAIRCEDLAGIRVDTLCESLTMFWAFLSSILGSFPIGSPGAERLQATWV